MSMEQKRILVVDDDQAMLRALDKVLTGEGARVTTAAGVGPALQHLRCKTTPFDIVLTDLRMRDGGGWRILEAVREELPRVPVIVITAFSNPRLQSDCRALGVTAFLEKPLDTQQLLAALIQARSRQPISYKHEHFAGAASEDPLPGNQP
jgi:DNA-binding NtrC family response regulator